MVLQVAFIAPETDKPKRIAEPRLPGSKSFRYQLFAVVRQPGTNCLKVTCNCMARQVTCPVAQ